MKYVSFSISSAKIIISMPSESEIEQLKKGLRELGIEVEEELRSLCG